MCYSLWYNAPTMLPGAWKRRNSVSRLPAGNIVVALYHKVQTQSSAPEDGRNHRPKHVELIGIINKPLLLHLVGCLLVYYCINDARSNEHQIVIFRLCEIRFCLRFLLLRLTSPSFVTVQFRVPCRRCHLSLLFPNI